MNNDFFTMGSDPIVFTENCSLGKLLAPLHELNVHFRGFEEHI